MMYRLEVLCFGCCHKQQIEVIFGIEFDGNIVASDMFSADISRVGGSGHLFDSVGEVLQI